MVGGRYCRGQQSVGERSAIGRRKVGKVRHNFQRSFAIESTIIAEYSLIQFVPDLKRGLFALIFDLSLGRRVVYVKRNNRISYSKIEEIDYIFNN